MAKAVIAYDKDLPEIPGPLPVGETDLVPGQGRCGPERLARRHSGRRPSRLLLVQKIRAAVDALARAGYPGASDVTRRLFEYWFEEDHEVAGFAVPFRYHFCQREAIETLVWLVEVAGHRGRAGADRGLRRGLPEGPVHQEHRVPDHMDGRRQIRRYVPELDTEGVQDLPPEDLRRFAFKMATGSGKTWVMAMAIVWSYFHKKRVPVQTSRPTS